jgi:hypothetical protein
VLVFRTARFQVQNFRGIRLSELKDALTSAKIKIVKYDPAKQRPVTTSIGTMDIRKFSGTLLEKLGADMLKFPEIIKAAHDQNAMRDMLEEYTKGTGTLVADDKEVVIPAELQEYTLNVNLAAKKGEDQFFLTTKDEFVSRMTGNFYIQRCNMPPPIAYSEARAVIPEYHPRKGPGIFPRNEWHDGRGREDPQHVCAA